MATKEACYKQFRATSKSITTFDGRSLRKWEEIKAVLKALASAYCDLVKVLTGEEDSLKEVKTALLEAEELLHGRRSAQAKKEGSPNGQVFHTTTKKSGGKRRCNYCKKAGHVDTQCWEKHPELKQERKNKATRRNQARKEHSPGASEARITEEAAERSGFVFATIAESPSPSDAAALTQYEKKAPTSWVLDSAASCHMTPC
eukprot:12916433-Prorocentrum_lima.AAC.1